MMKKIHLMALDNVEHLVQPEDFNEITIDSPALTIFTDFKQHLPLVIDADTPAMQADYLMKKAHVRLKLVVDENNELIGTISLQELNGQHIQILQNQGIDREDINVRDLMIPRSQQKVVNYQQLVDATIGDVLDALQKNGTSHCLVVDKDQHQIRGIISASDIARRLHIPVEIATPTTFIDIFKAVNGMDRPFSPSEQFNIVNL
ncbi:CBS domain-containing protein [Methylophaga sp. OBS4]|uniref:CBS domain-containing protein n=1 Tax=Methylophaga sp. OBS4 TaxID=2991935 RepID=UPI0022507CC2|nr:CBS domain-containing protein [Methylophaga sp. OBS4]MCX4187015.1 CBS domain-containing protein [Methylophaga sp. OBS4]